MLHKSLWNTDGPHIMCDMSLLEMVAGPTLVTVRQQIVEMARLNPACEYLIITRQAQEYNEVKKLGNLHLYPINLQMKRGMLVQHQLLLTRVLKHTSPDILYIPNGVAAIGWDGPLILAIYDHSFLRGEFPITQSMPSFYWSTLLRESMQRAQAIITTCERSYRELRASWPSEALRAHTCLPADAAATTSRICQALYTASPRHARAVGQRHHIPFRWLNARGHSRRRPPGC